MNLITVHPDGSLTVFGANADRVYCSRDFATGERNSDVIRDLRTNPNYGPGEHPMWVSWKSGGLASIRPALLEPGDEPDLLVVLE